MKIYLSKINESWIIDRIRKEWLENNPNISTKSIYMSDVIWIISPWLWRSLPKKQLAKKKVICSHPVISWAKEPGKILLVRSAR